MGASRLAAGRVLRDSAVASLSAIINRQRLKDAATPLELTIYILRLITRAANASRPYTPLRVEKEEKRLDPEQHHRVSFKLKHIRGIGAVISAFSLKRNVAKSNVSFVGKFYLAIACVN